MAKTKKNKDVVEMTGKAVVVAPVQEEQQVQATVSVEALIAQAIEKGTPVETMERILAMAKEIRAERAKEAFDIAMSNFQRECPIIKKTKIVYEKNQESLPIEKRKIRYSFAPIDSIVEQTKGSISKNGLSYNFIVENTDKGMTQICRVKHVLGHSEDSPFFVPIGTEQYMSDVQKYGARATFAKRYAFCNAFGIMTGDDDNDANVDETPKNTRPVAPVKPVAPKKAEPKVETPEQFEDRMKVIGEIAKYLKDMNQTMTEKAEQFFRDITLKELQQLEEAYKKRRDAYVAAHPEAIPTI